MLTILKVLKNILQHPFNRKNNRRWKGMLIFFRWQFSQLLFNRPILFELTNKCIIRIDKGRSGITGSLYMGLLEYWEMCFVTRIMEEDDLFLDIGANVGVYSILAGVHGKSECHSFEPVPSTFEILSQNFLLNKIKGKVYNLGVSNSEGHLFFSTENDCVNKVVEDDYIGIKTKVAVTSIDSLKLSNRYVGIKLDIEGHEYYALEGMIETFLNNRILFVLVENNDPRVFCFLEELGFITYGYNVDSNSCIKIESSRTNLLFIRDISLIKERLNNINSFSVQGCEI